MHKVHIRERHEEKDGCAAEVGDEEGGGGVEPSAWRHKLIVPMLVELAALERLDISGELDGDGATQLAVIKVLKVPRRAALQVPVESLLILVARSCPNDPSAKHQPPEASTFVQLS